MPLDAGLTAASTRNAQCGAVVAVVVIIVVVIILSQGKGNEEGENDFGEMHYIQNVITL